MINFGPVPIGAVLPVVFDSFAGSTGASVTLTGLAVTDIEIYKGTSMTQRASDAGYALLDTDGIDIDGITGIHGFSIDTGDDTDSGFYASGSFYTVVVSAVTIDSQTVNFVAATFRCVTAESVAGQPKVDTAALAGNATNATNLGTAASNYSATRGLAGTALPAAAADAAGGLPISDAGGLDMDSIKTDTAAILADTGTDGVVVAAASKTGYSLTATTGLGNQTANITGSLSGSVGGVTAAVAITSNIKQNQALAGFTFLMTDSTNHAPATGLTVAVTRSINGGAFAAGTLSAVTEVSDGVYSVDFGAGDLNGKTIILKATATGADTLFERIVTQV